MITLCFIGTNRPHFGVERSETGPLRHGRREGELRTSLVISAPAGDQQGSTHIPLLSRQEHRYSRGDDRERITRARQAAEALFRVKPPVSVPSVADAAADQSSRKPRVLRVTSPPPTGVEEPKASVSLEPLEPASTPSISPPHFARMGLSSKGGLPCEHVKISQDLD